VPNEVVELHADVEIQPTLPKPIIKHWEELVHNKHRTGLGYDKDVLSYSRLLKAHPISECWIPS